jgi:hypothetical protein
MPDSLIRCFARVIRLAMVASGTRNARATSAVVRPPTARRVSGTCAPGVSDGWQHRNSSVSVSSESGARGASAAGARNWSRGTRVPAVSSRRRRAISLRSWSVIRRCATRTSQPRGLSGRPSFGHCSEASSRAS